MKNLASTSTLLLVCAGCGLLSLGFGSCGDVPSTSVEIDSGAREDSGLARDSAPPDTALPDAGLVPEAGADVGSGPDAGEDAGSCGLPQTSLGTTCDECVATNCEPTWCACVADPAVVGDGGSGCQSYVQCVESCVTADAGSPTDCLVHVCAVPPYTAAEEQEGHSFLDCLVQYCGSECGQ